MSIDPDSQNALFRLALLADVQGELALASGLYQDMLRRDAENGAALHNLAASRHLHFLVYLALAVGVVVFVPAVADGRGVARGAVAAALTAAAVYLTVDFGRYYVQRGRRLLIRRGWYPAPR